MYRDEDNYKLFGSVYLVNKNKISLTESKRQVKEKLIDGEYFYPQDSGIKLFSEHSNAYNSFGGWYEFDEITETEKEEKFDLDFQIFLN